MAAEDDTIDDDDKDGAAKRDLAGKWLALIDRAERDLQPYFKRCDTINKIYTDARSNGENVATDERKFAMLWSNMCTLQPAVYARVPQPVVQRRYRDRDPVARQVCNFMERALEYNYDRVQFDDAMQLVRDDFLLFARGTARVRYQPTIVTDEEPDPSAPESEPMERVVAETAPVDHVHYRDFIHPKSRNWAEVPWVAFRVHLTRQEVADRFGKKVAKELTYTHKLGKDGEDEDAASASAGRKATIYEVWSKTDGKCIWVSREYDKPLDYADPHLELEGFFPTPKPAYGTKASDSLIPIPDFVYYQDQAREIDDLTNRIAALIDSLKVVGFYPAGPDGEGSAAIERAVKPGAENLMIPVSSWAAFAEKGGANQIQWMPVDQVAKVLEACFKARKAMVEDVYQITGISDILRGESDPHETAAAQGIKAQWGSIRIRDRQAELARYARDLTRIQGEIIADKFQPETLMEMTGLHLRTDEEVQGEYQQQLAEFAMAQQAAQQQAMMAQQQPQMPPQGGPPQMGAM